MTQINTGWRKGQSVRMAMVRCCPECGATILGVGRTRYRRVRERICKACGTKQSNVADDQEDKAVAVGFPAPMLLKI